MFPVTLPSTMMTPTSISALTIAPFADDEHVVGEDLARELAVDADGALERQLAFELRPAAEERGDLALRPFTLCRKRHGP